MNLRLLKWLAIVIPLAGATLLLYGLRSLAHPFLDSWPGFAAIIALVALGVFLFSNIVFRVVERMQQTILSQNQELARLNQEAWLRNQRLRALHDASLALTAQPSLEAVLQKVADLSRELVKARYAALVLVDQKGQGTQWVTSGLDPEHREAMSHFLERLLKEGRPLRLSNVTQLTSAPVSPLHPQLTSLLGVPLAYKGRVQGGIYVANKEETPEFTQEDEDTLNMLATQAGAAIENARLYQEVQTLAVVTERERIAREMHDSLAQVLGYVNLKTQAIRELITSGQLSEARSQLEQLEQAARGAYADVREGILALRSTDAQGRGLLPTLEEYIRQFSQQSGVATELVREGPQDNLHLQPTAEVQLLRIIQEALTNVRKHAQARHARVRLVSRDQEYQVSIEDDGRGFDPLRISRDEWPHLGLQTMQERAEAIGASFELHTAPGQGTRVTVRIPQKNQGKLSHAGTTGG